MDYDPSAYPRVAVTVDLVLLTLRRGALHALAVRRGEEPFTDRWALPGGFLRPGETLDAAAYRELDEETGLGPSAARHLEQLASYGDPERDPRMRVVTVAYLALAPALPDPVAGGDVVQARFVPVDTLLAEPLAFDHARILADGVERARSKLEYTPLAAAFCPPEFTIADLRVVYDTVWGTTLDPRNFHRKATGTPGFLEPVPRRAEGGPGRPAQLYRVGPIRVLHPALLRPRA